MKRFSYCLMMGLLPAAVWADDNPAPVCSPEKTAEVLAAATPNKRSVRLDCSLILPPNQVVEKNVELIGEQAGRVVLDCQGSRLVRREGESDNLSIRSEWRDNGWSRPHGITIRNCRIDGALRISGMDDERWKQASFVRDNTAAIQNAAPYDILLENLEINGSSRVPLYLRPGVTGVTLRNSRIGGWSQGPAVYLDAETANNVLVDNVIAVTTPREQLAVDGSAKNLIAGNRFPNPKNGGIYLYRNCGERGMVRHQTPSYNRISGNYFDNKSARFFRPMIWLSSRNGWRKFCRDDSGYDFGSSADNKDYAEYNEVTGNRFTRYLGWWTIRDSSKNNRVQGNIKASFN